MVCLMVDNIRVNQQKINEDNQQQQLDKEYFQKHPQKSYYVRERLEMEHDMSSSYVLVFKLGENERIRYPLETKHVSRQKIKQIKKLAKKLIP